MILVSARTLLVAVVASALAFLPHGAEAALQLSFEAGPAFRLVEFASAEGTRWYEAEAWLGRLPGRIEWEENAEKLTYREGDRVLTLQSTPPYALHGGRPLGDAPANRVMDGRLVVSERFLVERASDFLGRRVSAEPVHGTGVLRIVIDPGHGGEDRGTASPGAPFEKDAVLQLALETAAKLRKRGYEVRLTREDDRALSSVERASLANRLQADLFLSLHASGSRRPQARGIEVFVAEAPPSEVDGRQWAHGQVGRSAESRRWAEAVRAEAGRALASFDRGLREIPSSLLEAVAAPACLLEAGNLSWPGDAEVFAKTQARGTLAAALADAADDYFRTAP